MISAGGSSGSGSSSSSSGFRDLPPEIQDSFKALATQAQSYLPGNYGGYSSGISGPAQTTQTQQGSQGQPQYISGYGVGGNLGYGSIPNPAYSPGGTTSSGASGGVGSMAPTGSTADWFRPMGQTDAETKALAAIGQGFAPTQASLNSDIAMQQNPFDKYVIDEINRQSMGDFSILKQNASQTGTFGSNRQALGANDIDLSRLNQIGSFKQQGFNTALNNAMTTLPQQRAADAQSQLQGGAFQRSLGMQQQQAPLNALASVAQILGVLPTNSSQSSGSSKSSGFNFGLSF